MKKIIFISGLLAALAGSLFFSCRPERPAPEKAIAATLSAQVDSFSTLCTILQAAVESGAAEDSGATAGKKAIAGKSLQDLFLQTRLAYKKFEWAAEYFEPTASRAVNGPPVQEVEVSGQVFEPAGLQVIEGLLFPSYDSTRKEELLRQLRLLQGGCNKYKSHFDNIELFDWQVFDASKLEMFRIATLGITGFDDPLTQNSMMESAVSLESLQGVLGYYAGEAGGGKNDAAKNAGGKRENDNGGAGSLTENLAAAVLYLTQHPDFNSFDRAEFIAAHCNPLTRSLSDLETKLQIHVIKYNRLLNQEAKTLFDTNAYKVDAYAPDPSSFATPEKILLGKVLFADPALSGTGTRSCQSCHQPEKAFTDGLVKNTVLGNTTLLKRNTPTLLNSALQPSLFYDLRVNRLEEQSQKVVQSNEEMHGSLQAAVKRLWEDKTYRQLFSKAFPKKDRTGIDTLEVMNAIGSYVRSLVALNSRFDEYMRGNPAAMKTDEIKGFNLFMGKAKCATCHYIPLFNGTFPPRFVKTEAEVIGVPADTIHPIIDPDRGRYDVVKIESFLHAFKTPTLRNAARTAPYMHNGVYTTLEQVMDFYNKGGGVGLGIKMDNQTLPFDRLNLTDQERGELIAFIRSLDSR